MANDIDHDDLIEQASIKLCPIGITLIHHEHETSKSRSACNTVFHHCDVMEQRRSYTSCLAIMDLAFAAGDDELPIALECQAAIRNGTCPAVRMRKAELQAGRALFYVDYVELMRRRAAQAEIDAESSPIQFRRKKAHTKFTPTVMPSDVAAPATKRKPAPRTTAEPEMVDYEPETNIMEQVLKKVINDSNN